LREAGLAGRTVTLKLRFADFRTITRGRTLAVVTDTDTELHEVAAELLARLQLGRAPVRLVGVTVSNLQRAGAPVQLRLGPERPGWEAAVRAADAGRARLGGGAVDPRSPPPPPPPPPPQALPGSPPTPPPPPRSAPPRRPRTVRVSFRVRPATGSPRKGPEGVAGWPFA